MGSLFFLIIYINGVDYVVIVVTLRKMNTHEIYAKVINIVRYFVNNAAHLDITQLKNYNPSIEDLAKDIKRLSLIIRLLSTNDYDDENMSINALQCCLELERLADVVSEGNDNDLNDIFHRLNMLITAPS